LCTLYIKEDEEDKAQQLKVEIVSRMMEEHLLTDACLQHLAAFVDQPSERLTLYHEKNFTKLSQSSVVGIFEKSKNVLDFVVFCLHYLKPHPTSIGSISPHDPSETTEVGPEVKTGC